MSKKLDGCVHDPLKIYKWPDSCPYCKQTRALRERAVQELRIEKRMNENSDGTI